MVLFKSPHPDIQVPTDITTWEWLFESKEYSPLYGKRPLAGFVDAETKERLDWREVKHKATLLSRALVRWYGLEAGRTVSLFSTNVIWYPVAMFAVIRAGGRVNGASPAYTVEEMAYALKTARARVLLTLPESIGVAVEAAERVGLGKENVLLLRGRVDGFVSIQDLIAREEQEGGLVEKPYRVPRGMDNRQVCGYLNFSSGTTGLPKAVMLSHHNIIGQCLQLRQLQADPDTYKILAVMPLFHITGLVRFCHYPILMNGESIMLPKFNMQAMLQAIIDFRVEELILVPPILLRLARDPVVDQFNLRHVKRWSSGSAPISPEVIRSLQKRFPWTGFRQGYGATESTACITCHPPTHYDYKYAATVGMLVANTVAKVIDLGTGKELGRNETGEILAKGPQIAMGYLDNEKATNETFMDGFLHTGDVGHIDDEGLLWIEDRIKEMIKVKGLQVPPAELEDLLLGHRDVADCAVVSIADDYAGERPKAFVVLKTQASEDKGRELLAFVKERKVRYKWLAEVEFVAEIPKSSTGKLLRRVLKNQGKEGKIQGLKVKEDRINAKL